MSTLFSDPPLLGWLEGVELGLPDTMKPVLLIPDFDPPLGIGLTHPKLHIQLLLAHLTKP